MNNLLKKCKKYIRKNGLKAFVFKAFSKVYNSAKNHILFLIYNKSSFPKILIIDHSLGGGAEVFIINEIEKIKQNNAVYRLQFYPRGIYYKITIYYKNIKIIRKIRFYKKVQGFLDSIFFSKLIYNDAVGYEKAILVLDLIKRAARKGTKIIVLGNDYHTICPSYNLINDKREFCSIPEDFSICLKCFPGIQLSSNIKENKILMSGISDISEWRNGFKDLYENYVDELIVFSESSKKLFLKAYPVIESKIKVVPHEVIPLRKINVKEDDIITIGILGSINCFQKGKDVILEMNSIIKEKYNNVRLFIIGSFNADSTIAQTGRYVRSDIPTLAEENNIDLIFIPSVVPETFSYTTSEAIQLGIPVASFNLGASPEKIMKYDKGLIISKIDPQTALEEIINYLKKMRHKK